MPDNEKRRLKRHPLVEHIHLKGTGQALTGRTVDISRDGMKIRIDGNHSIHPDTMISINLPGTAGEGIPCRIRRSSQQKQHWELGLEFDGESDARMLLVERWLENLEKRSDIRDSAPTESRQVPRTRCSLKDIRCTDGSIEVLSVDDISLEGMLLSIRGSAPVGSRIPLELVLSDTGKKIRFKGRVAYSGDDDGTGRSIGLALENIRQVDRNRLRNFIVEIASGAAMLEYQQLLVSDEPSEEYRITGSEARSLMAEIASEGIILNVLDEHSLRILETRCDELDGLQFKAPSPEPVEQSLSSSDQYFFSFILEGSSFSFTTRRIRWSKGQGTFRIPEVIYRGEKRASSRQTVRSEAEILFDSSERCIQARVLDSSRRGLNCVIAGQDMPEGSVAVGDGLEISFDGIVKPAEVRHILTDSDENDEIVIRLGLELGVLREEPESRTYTRETWDEEWKGESRPIDDPACSRSERVEFRDRQGRRISALLHINAPGEECTAVLIPPAFGKKKEVTAPLALTLMTHFNAIGRNLAVLRYDGIDRPGESDNANRFAKRGYEMLGYRIDQGYRDLEASMEWLKSNELFTTSKIILLSFSMAALDARRLQSSEHAPKADYWISVMGVSSAQGALRNILGGLDVVANYRMGLPVGTMGMLGQLIDMDRMTADMVRLGYAMTTDARESMARINSPVTWIYGTFDKWMIPEEIRDVMSIRSSGNREIIEIPTAHNLRTSEDAISAFQMITGSILDYLGIRYPQSYTPDKKELLDLLGREREQVIRNEELDSKTYWKGYLLGESDSEEGYDFYRNLVEFREFLGDEVQMLDPRPGESIADMGCGTGLVSEAILNYMAAADDLSGTRFTAVDLVDEALKKAESKYVQLCRDYPVLTQVENRWIAMNLEPDPLAPVREYMNAPITQDKGGIRFFNGRIKGLTVESVDRIEGWKPEIIDAVLRGHQPDNELLEEMNDNLGTTETLILEDLGRAARFVTGDLYEEDLKPSIRESTGEVDPARCRQLRSSALLTTSLDFGDADFSGSLSIPDESFDRISASLFLSYLFAPLQGVREFVRMLKPGGRLLLSSMIPDSDISGIFTRYIDEQSSLTADDAKASDREHNLREVRSMLNEAASLFSLEEDGWFRFFEEKELVSMMRDAGLTNIRTMGSLGDPPQAIIVIGEKNI